MSAHPGTRVYRNAELGVRFEIDDSFTDGSPLEPSPGLGNVRSAYLAAQGPSGEQAVLSISRVEVGYDTSPRELAEQLVIHNRYAAHTAEQNGWTIHSPWKATMLAGYPAMHCDYVVPGFARESGSVGEAGSVVSAGQPVGRESPLAASGGEPSSPGHVQAWIAYAGRQTFQVTLGVNPPGDLAGNRAVVDTVVRTFEITAPGSEDTGGGRAQ